MVADDFSLTAAGALFLSLPSTTQEERDVLLRRRLPELPISRTRVAASTVADAGMGLFATRDIEEGELVTMYPGDALALWNKEAGGSGSIHDARVVGGSSNSEWAAKWKAQDSDFIAEVMGYAVYMGATRAIIGDPAQRADAAYLGHMANDAATCVQPGTAKQVYQMASAAGSNVCVDTESLSHCHHALVATKPIACGCEIFVSYGASYWLAYSHRTSRTQDMIACPARPRVISSHRPGMAYRVPQAPT